LKPDHVFNQYTLGTIYYEECEYENALRKFLIVVTLKPKIKTYKKSLALTYKKMGKINEAL